MFDEIFLKQRDLLNNMKDKQMFIDYIVYNVDLILVKLINLYRDNTYEEADRTSLKNKVYSTLGDFTYLLPHIFIENYINDAIYLEKNEALPYHDVIIPYDSGIGSKHFFRYMLFIMWMTMTNNNDILENIKFIMYSKISEDNSKLSTPFIYYCKRNSVKTEINVPHAENPNSYFATTCYMPVCKNCILSRKINDRNHVEYNPCHLVRNRGLFIRDIMEAFYYAFSCGLLLAIVTNEKKIKTEFKKLNLRNSNKAKCFKRSADNYLNYCVNRRKGLIYNLREEIIKTAIVNIFGDVQLARFFSGINSLNNYLVKSEKRYKNGL